MTKAANEPRLAPPLAGPWVVGVAVGVLAGAGAYLLGRREDVGPLAETLTRWPAPLLHGAAAALLGASLAEWLSLLTRPGSVPREAAARREWAVRMLGHCGEQFGRRAVADDPAGAAGRVAGLARSRLADRWSLYAIAGLLLGLGWLLLFLARNTDDLPATREGSRLLLAGLAESAAVLAAAALLWLAWTPRLRGWEADARRALTTSAAESVATPAPQPVVALPTEEPAPALVPAPPRLPRGGGRLPRAGES